VDVVGHQAPGEAADAAVGAGFAHQLQVGGIVLVAEEDRLAPVAALGDVMSDVGDDEAGEASHGESLHLFASDLN
jgi:hypothetical protein